MSKTTRRLIFYALVLLFFILGFIAVYYSTGWRLDFKNFKFEHVGAIYIQAHPSSANIYIDNKLINVKPSFFQSGIIINDLLPNSYNLKVTADGYQTFSQDIAVAPFLVSTLNDLILIPKTINYFSTSTVKDFWLIKDNLLIQNNKDYLFLNNIKISGQYLVGQLDNQKLLTENSNKDYFLINPSIPSSTIYLSNFAKNYLGTNNVQFFPDPQNNTLLTISNQYIGWLNTDNWTFSPPLTISTSTAKLLKNSSQIIINSNTIYALLDGKLTAIDFSGNSLAVSTTSSPVNNFAVSLDNSKIALLEKNQIEILQTNNKDIITIPLKADRVIWYNDNRHLFAINNNLAYFLDIKNPQSTNYQLDVKSNKFEYDANKNQLYFLCPANNSKNNQDQNICYLQFPD